jgi:hypothetical protein
MVRERFKDKVTHSIWRKKACIAETHLALGEIYEAGLLLEELGAALLVLDVPLVLEDLDFVGGAEVVAGSLGGSSRVRVRHIFPTSRRRP